MSDYINLLAQSDQPKIHYNLKNQASTKKFAESLNFTYMKNDELDKKEGANEKQLIIAPVAKLNQGMGVFSTADMPYNAQHPKVFGQYKGVRINIKDLDLSEIDTSYYFDDPERKNTHYRIDAKHQANWARFMNHCENPNVQAEIKHNRVWFKQSREIKAGDQLFINYGHEYDFSEYDKFYLNTNDNWLSVADYYAHPTHAYAIYPIPSTKNKITPIELGFDKTTTSICLPKLYRQMLAKKTIDNLDNPDWNLPIVGIKNVKAKKELTPKQPYTTLLMLAAYTGKFKLIETMIAAKNAKMNINLQQTYTGRTALYFVLAGNASAEVKIKMITLLLNKGANPYLIDFEGKNLFHYCADQNNAKIFEAILKHPKIDLKKATLLIECPQEECLANLAKNLDLAGYLLANKKNGLFEILLKQGDAKKIWLNLTGVVPSSNHITQLRYISNLLNTKEREKLRNYIVEKKLLAASHPKQKSILAVLNSDLKQKLEKKMTTEKKASVVKKPHVVKKTVPSKKTPVRTKGNKQASEPMLILFNHIKVRDKNLDGSRKRKINPSQKMKEATGKALSLG